MADNENKALDMVPNHDEFAKSDFEQMTMDGSHHGLNIRTIRRKADWQIVPLMCMLACLVC